MITKVFNSYKQGYIQDFVTPIATSERYYTYCYILISDIYTVQIICTSWINAGKKTGDLI